jgi:ADP-ribose pyrophosphatase YjhB (NUDIX family)
LSQDREYPAHPIVGVLAVVRRDGRVLLVQRAKPPRSGSWGFIGGVQELGETVAETAVRELKEETGVVAAAVEPLTVLDAIYPDGDGRIRTHFTLVCVLLDWRSGEPQADADALAIGWFTPEEAQSSKMRLFPSTVRVMRLALAHSVPQDPRPAGVGRG